jgi:hypothetical protein
VLDVSEKINVSVFCPRSSNLQSISTLSNLQSISTPSKLQSISTPSNLQSISTSSNLQSISTPSNLQSISTPNTLIILLQTGSSRVSSAVLPYCCKFSAAVRRLSLPSPLPGPAPVPPPPFPFIQILEYVKLPSITSQFHS